MGAPSLERRAPREAVRIQIRAAGENHRMERLCGKFVKKSSTFCKSFVKVYHGFITG